jgi:Protein of unknown function (DUF2786)
MTMLPDDAVLDRLKKLLNLAAKNTSPEEAASAAAKASELLARYNLDVATVEGARPEAGKREEAKVDGGTYVWQRELWSAVAELNFCVHWVQVHAVWRKGAAVGSGRARYTVDKFVLQKRHVLVGRVVNTRATLAMAGYLQQAIERELVSRLHGDDAGAKQAQRFSRWAVSFRRGATRRILEKLKDRRDQLAADEALKARAARAAAERVGASTATGVTLAQVKASEAVANYDFMHGEGAWAARLARREAIAKDRREREQAHARWAAEHPEEAAAQAAKQQREAEKLAKRGHGRRGREAAYRGPDYDVGAFWDGYDKAADIGLDQQMSGTKAAGALR